MVLQNPEAQIITPTVEEELAFPLENQGKDPAEIRAAVQRMLTTLNLTPMAMRNPLSLSGGECQRISLGAALIQQPEILFLDEPTSYLDEEQALQFFEELTTLPSGITIVMVEHRLELVRSFCTTFYRMENGTITPQSKLMSDEISFQPKPMVEGLYPQLKSMPDESSPDESLPEPQPSGSLLLESLPSESLPLHSQTRLISQPHLARTMHSSDTSLLEIRNLTHTYEGNPPLFSNLKFTVPSGSVQAIMGPSGSGKTTILKKILRMLPIEKGTLFLEGTDVTTIEKKTYYQNLAYIPQNPEHLFLGETVQEDLTLALTGDHQVPQMMDALELARFFKLDHRLSANPFKLSEGEKRRLTLCIALGMHRKLLLLDEPTYGLDRALQQQLAGYLAELSRGGIAIVLVSHDTSFVKQLHCATFVLKDGELQEVSL
jgi:energy-coupling factor transport system ATP-binding protein